MNRTIKILTSLFIIILCVITFSCCQKNAAEDLFLIKSGNQYGFINKSGKIVITPQFDMARPFGDANFAPFKLDGKWGYINRRGEIVIAAEFDESYCFSKEGIARIQKDGKWGYINSDGIVFVSPQYDYAYPFNERHAIIVKGDSLGVININGEIHYIENAFNLSRLRKSAHPINDYTFTENVIPIDISYQLDSGLFFIGYSYVDTLGNIVNDTTYLWGRSSNRNYYNGLAVYSIHERYGFLNHKGEMVIDTIYDKADRFSEGIAAVCLNEKWGYIDTLGNNIIDFKYDGWGLCSEGIIAVKKGEKWGFVKSSGTTLVDPQYDMVYNFSEGLAAVKKGEKYGYIDTCGNIVIPIQYYKPSSFSKGLARIIDEDGRWMYINNHGDTIWRDETIQMDTSENIWDMGMDDFSNVGENISKYKEFFLYHIHDLDPIEGLYHVYRKEVVRNNYTGQVSETTQPSDYWAIVKGSWANESTEYEMGKNFMHICKHSLEEGESAHDNYSFKRIGETNAYNITGDGGGKLIMDNPLRLTFIVEWGHNDFYTGYFEYELIRDYPTGEMLENISQSEWSGTGFAIGDGYLVTNYHVVNGAKRISIIDYSEDATKRYNTQVVAFDNKNDLAILKIIDSKFKGTGAIPYAFNTTLTDVGEEVFVLGYPLTESMGEEIKLTTGVTSSTKGYQDNNAQYQISTPIQPGNSGGPLFDSKGDVIGIVCAKHKEAENAGYAIKMLYLENLIKSNNLSISLSRKSKIHSKSLPKKVKKVKGFVYKIECSN